MQNTRMQQQSLTEKQEKKPLQFSLTPPPAPQKPWLPAIGQFWFYAGGVAVVVILLAWMFTKQQNTNKELKEVNAEKGKLDEVLKAREFTIIGDLDSVFVVEITYLAYDGKGKLTKQSEKLDKMLMGQQAWTISSSRSSKIINGIVATVEIYNPRSGHSERFLFSPIAGDTIFRLPFSTGFVNEYNAKRQGK